MSNILTSQQWIVGICSIIFDIDVGQRIEHLVPDGCLSQEEQQDVAFHSFPDSMSMELHARTSIKDSTFFFRVRRRGSPPGPANGQECPPADSSNHSAGGPDGSAAASPDKGTSVGTDATANGASANGGQKAPSSSHGRATNGHMPDGSGEPLSSGSDERFLYGFVFCRQRQDASLRRGGEQMSVVVLAEHPLSSVLLPLAAVAGQQYFGAPGRGPLLQVLEEVGRWPGPVAGAPLQLQVGFTALSARLPGWGTLPAPSTVSAAEQYGGNAMPHSRGPSSRVLLGGVGPPRRTATTLEDSGLPPRSGSGVVVGAVGLSPAISIGAVLLGAGGGAGTSPFSMGSGMTEPPPSQLAVAPPQQHLERRSSTDPPTSCTPSTDAFTSAAIALDASGGSGSSTSLGPSSGSATLHPDPPTPLPQLSGLGLLGEGCSPAAAAVLPPGVFPLGGGSSGGQSAQHARSRSSVQVPSRTGSYAGATDDPLQQLLAAGGPAGAAGPGSALSPAPAPASSAALSAAGGRQGYMAYDGAWGEEGGGGRARTTVRRIASAGAVPGSGPEIAGAAHGAFHEVDVFTPLSGHLPRLWQLWELTLLGRALLLVAPSPGETSAGVAALLALIAPLPYSSDFRPYYCIHDAAFGRMAAGVLPGPEARDVPTLLGITNLYFIRALPHWPNVLAIGKREGAVAALQPAPGPLAASMLRANAAVQALRQRTQGASVLLSGHMEALWSTYKPLCRPDSGLLGKLMQPKAGDVRSKVARIALVNSDTLRRHFSELTISFLSPFARYFEPDRDGRVPGWNSEEFLFGLRSGGVPLPQPLMDRVGSASAAVELYARFTSSLNFAAWFAARRRHVAHLIAPPPPPVGLRGVSRGGLLRGEDSERGPGGLGAEASGGGGGANGAAGRVGSVPRRRGSGDAGGSGGTGLGGSGGSGEEERQREEEEEGGIASWFASAAQHLDEVKLIGMFFSVEQQLLDAQTEAAGPDPPDEAAASVARLRRELRMLFFGGAMSEELQLTCVSSPGRRALLASLDLVPSQAARLAQLTDMLQGGGK